MPARPLAGQRHVPSHRGTGPLDCHGHGCAATGTGCHSERPGKLKKSRALPSHPLQRWHMLARNWQDSFRDGAQVAKNQIFKKGEHWNESCFATAH